MNSVTRISTHCPSLIIGNTVTLDATNLSLLGAGCVTDHDAVGP